MMRCTVLASGRGSDFQAICDAVAAGTCPVELVRLITDNPSALAIGRAHRAGVPVTIIDRTSFPDRAAYEAALREAMEVSGAELFVLAGYMRLLSPETVRAFPDRMINIHPALLPAFPGLRAPAQAVEHGVRFSGCTVHFVTEEMDAGPVILQACVPVREDDDAESLAARILVEEHRILPEAIRLYAEGRLERVGRRVRVLSPATD
ncbi:MAG TPA: phosphoribosylglycinamide formyltransferase [Methanoregulaceae archaeon]|nr:phosphoribosylglycinamide formyltransferase [Methanoregulaceae archaeon]